MDTNPVFLQFFLIHSKIYFWKGFRFNSNLKRNLVLKAGATRVVKHNQKYGQKGEFYDAKILVTEVMDDPSKERFWFVWEKLDLSKQDLDRKVFKHLKIPTSITTLLSVLFFIVLTLLSFGSIVLVTHKAFMMPTELRNFKCALARCPSAWLPLAFNSSSRVKQS